MGDPQSRQVGPLAEVLKPLITPETAWDTRSKSIRHGSAMENHQPTSKGYCFLFDLPKIDHDPMT